MAAVYHLEIEQGADWSIEFDWTDAAGNPVDLTGYTARMQIRDSQNDVQVAELTEADAIDLTGNTITISLDHDETAALDPQRGVYDLFLTSPGLIATKLLAGEAVVVERVTR